jgi:hypothetical protein
LGGTLLAVKEKINGVDTFMKEKGNIDKAILIMKHDLDSRSPMTLNIEQALRAVRESG